MPRPTVLPTSTSLLLLTPARVLQDKVLATAAKIVQKRFLADKDLDRK